MSFIIGGVGTSNNASISDIFNSGGGGSGSTESSSPPSITALQKKVKVKPNNAQAWSHFRKPYAGATHPADEAGAWTHFLALKPGNFEGPAAPCSGPGADGGQPGRPGADLFSSRPLRRRPATTPRSPAAPSARSRRTPSSQAQAAADSDQQTQALLKASVSREEGEHLVEEVQRHLQQDRRAAGLQVERPRGNNLGSTTDAAAQSANDPKSAIKAYNAFLKLAPEDTNTPQVRSIMKQLKERQPTTATPSTATP